MIRKLAFLFLRLSLVPFFIREVIQRKKATIIVYHSIEPNIADIHFRTLKSKYNVISLGDYVRAKKIGTLDNLPPKSLVITFDDGYGSNYKLKPLFAKHQIPSTIFLCSAIVNTNRHFWFEHKIGDNNLQFLKSLPNEKRLKVLMEYGFEEKKEFKERQALSKNEIMEMTNIVDFQSHTMFHPILTRCSDARVYREISESKEDLEHNFRLKIYALAYPNGDYSDREIAIAKEAGYECGLTLDIGFNSQNTDLFRLKRIPMRDESDINELIVKTSGLWGYIRKVFKNQKENSTGPMFNFPTTFEYLQ